MRSGIFSEEETHILVLDSFISSDNEIAGWSGIFSEEETHILVLGVELHSLGRSGASLEVSFIL
jgi:hypothetical protein